MADKYYRKIKKNIDDAKYKLQFAAMTLNLKNNEKDISSNLKKKENNETDISSNKIKIGTNIKDISTNLTKIGNIQEFSTYNKNI